MKRKTKKKKEGENEDEEGEKNVQATVCFLQMIMKNAFEKHGETLDDEEASTQSTAKKKAFDYYTSCMDKTKVIDSLGDEPLHQILEEVGNWNVSGNFTLNGDTDKGADNAAAEADWDLTKQLIKLHGRFSNSPFFFFYVEVDAKHSKNNVLVVDQSGLTLSRDFYVNDTKPENAKGVVACACLWGVGVSVRARETETETDREIKKIERKSDKEKKEKMKERKKEKKNERITYM